MYAPADRAGRRRRGPARRRDLDRRLRDHVLHRRADPDLPAGGATRQGVNAPATALLLVVRALMGANEALQRRLAHRDALRTAAAVAARV
jgi:hypothetical protein